MKLNQCRKSLSSGSIQENRWKYEINCIGKPFLIYSWPWSAREFLCVRQRSNTFAAGRVKHKAESEALVRNAASKLRNSRNVGCWGFNDKANRKLDREDSDASSVKHRRRTDSWCDTRPQTAKCMSCRGRMVPSLNHILVFDL